MFLTTMIQEDTTIVCASDDGVTYSITLHDSFKGTIHHVENVTASDYSALMMLIVDDDGTHHLGSDQIKKLYLIVEENILKDCPPECRPIP